MFESLARHFEVLLFASDHEPVITLVYILVAAMHIVSGLPLRSCGQLLVSLRFLFDLMIEDFDASKSQGKYLTKSVPLDARTVLKRLALNPRSKIFVSCPECRTCYLDNGPDSYPELCISKHPVTQVVCGQRLQKTHTVLSRQLNRPVSRFFYHDFNEWLGQMLCRPGMEDLMDRERSPRADGIMDDIWDAQGLYEIPGVDGQPFIRKCPDNEGHYLFSFNMDGFNPFQLKQAGRSATVTALYLVCLNLPPEVRFRSENIYLAGIIPGPSEPSKGQINHFLAPLVDDLYESYTNGTRYSRTWKYLRGRKTRSALALFICDLPAVRQALGFSWHSSNNFCSYCKLQRKDIGDLDHERWVPRTNKEHRGAALQWCSAPSANEREKITKADGVSHYSEFLRLPYVDPIRSHCVDTMHAFFLGLFSRHCQEIWKMDDKLLDGEGTTSDPVSRETKSTPEFQRAFIALRTKSLEDLRGTRRETLSSLTKDRGLVVKAQTRDQILDILTEYVISLLWHRPIIMLTVIHSAAMPGGLIITSF